MSIARTCSLTSRRCPRKSWDTIPGELQRKEKRFRIGSVKKGARTRDYELALFWLNEARVVYPCYNSTEPNIGLKMNVDYSKFKLYPSTRLRTGSLTEDEIAIVEGMN